MAKKLKAILLSVAAVSAAQILLKYGLKSAGEISFARHFFSTFLNLMLNPYILLGFVLFGASSVLWLIAISETDLSYAYPLLGMGYAIVAILSWLIFNETIGALRIAGIATIMLGIVLMSRS